MNDFPFLADIIKLTASGLIVFFAGWYVIRAYLNQRNNFQLLELKKASSGHLLPLRIQAYERLILFIERINPANMLVRLHVPGNGARDMHQLLVSDIRGEFQHNVAQQLYVSHMSWDAVSKLKDDTIRLISSAVAALPEEASAADLSRSILNHLSSIEGEDPYKLAGRLIRSEMQILF